MSIKSRWLEALRSGEYEQAKGTLYDQDTGGYCCLGVLQKVLDGKIERDNFDRPLSTPSAMWCQSHSIPHYFWSRPTECFDLTGMNDADEGCSFVKIADFIEEKYDDSLHLKPVTR